MAEADGRGEKGQGTPQDEEMIRAVEEPASEIEISKYERSTFFTFTVTEFSKREGKLYSPEHVFGGYRWRLLVFPKGNYASDNSTMPDCVSMYLDCLGPVTPSDPDARVMLNWTQNASFVMSVVSTKPNSTVIEKKVLHQFTQKNNDWGFTEFGALNTLLDPKEGFCVNDTITFKVDISLEEAPYDSRKVTGFAGFKNQGATCYMNSLLQTLYTLGTFRRGVYEMPLPEEINSNDITYALQRVFYDLQKGQGVVKTKKLTRSFGWDSADAFTQHDVQELNRLLTGHLEESLKKAKKKNYVAQLFEGKMCNYIECVNVPYKSEVEATFLDIPLLVKGCKDIYESLDKFTEVEVLDGDNKYKAEGYEELQAARKCQKIVKLPPVLQLHLVRMDYDIYREMAVKINDRFEFGDEIDLCKYVEGSDGTDVYILHSVLVHSGDVNGGHYYAFIRPDVERNKWYKFDDELVIEAKSSEALEDNFGYGGENRDSSDPLLSVRMRKDANVRKYTSAYWLQYIRKDNVNVILNPITDDEIRKELEERLQKENEEEERRKKEKAEQHLYMNVAILTESDLRNHQGSDLVDWSMVRKNRFRKGMYMSEFKERLLSSKVVEDSQSLRLWKMRVLENMNVRPDEAPLVVDETQILSSLLSEYTDDIRYNLRAYNPPEMNVRIFVEEIPEDTDAELGEDEILVFFKRYYSSPEPKLSYVAKAVLSKQQTIAEAYDAHLAGYLVDERGQPQTLAWEDLDFYEERYGLEADVNMMDPSLPIANYNVQQGSIFILQRKLDTDMDQRRSQPNPNAILQGRALPTCLDYFRYLKDRVRVTFRNRFPVSDSGPELELLLTDDERTVRWELAHALGETDIARISILESFKGENLFRQDSMTLLDMLRSVDMDAFKPQKPTGETKSLFYEFTDYNLDTVNQLDVVRVCWSPQGSAGRNESTMIRDPEKPWKSSQYRSIYLPRDETFQRMVDEFHKVLTIPFEKEQLHIVLLDKKRANLLTLIQQHQSRSDIEGMLQTRLSNPCLELRVEPIPEEDQEILSSKPGAWVQVVHVPKKRTGASRHDCFGNPFLIAVSADGEKVCDLRKRISRRLAIRREDSWRLAEMTNVGFVLFEDDQALWKPAEAPPTEMSMSCLAVEQDTLAKAPFRDEFIDKPLSIHN